jgi:hypothetical protein
MSNESNDFCKDMHKEQLKNDLIEILMKELEVKLKKNIQKYNSKNIKTTQIKNLRRLRSN